MASSSWMRREWPDTSIRHRLGIIHLHMTDLFEFGGPTYLQHVKHVMPGRRTADWSLVHSKHKNWTELHGEQPHWNTCVGKFAEHQQTYFRCSQWSRDTNARYQCTPRVTGSTCCRSSQFSLVNYVLWTLVKAAFTPRDNAFVATCRTAEKTQTIGHRPLYSWQNVHMVFLFILAKLYLVASCSTEK